MIRFVILLGIIALFAACETDINAVNELTESRDLQIEEAEEVVILYSDSAELKVRISAPTMIRHLSRTEPLEEFPDGIFVEFLGKNGRAYSWLEADGAIRNDKKNTITATGNVKFYNKSNETLRSPELIWEENKEVLHTDKFVQIAQPSKGDTSYGVGFESNQEFTRFEIKYKTAGRFNVDKFSRKD